MYRITRRHFEAQKHRYSTDSLADGTPTARVYNPQTGKTEVWPVEVVDSPILDYSTTTREDSQSPAWSELLAALDTGDPCWVSPSVYDYFLEVLPPRWMSGSTYVFTEGVDAPTLFQHREDRYLAQRMSWKEIREHLGLPSDTLPYP